VLFPTIDLVRGLALGIVRFADGTFTKWIIKHNLKTYSDHEIYLLLLLALGQPDTQQVFETVVLLFLLFDRSS